MDGASGIDRRAFGERIGPQGDDKAKSAGVPGISLGALRTSGLKLCGKNS